MSDEQTIRTAVAATLRTVMEWGTIATLTEDGRLVGSVSRGEMLSVIEQVETGDVSDWWCCPVCEETECDNGCPLEPLRTP